MGGLAWLGWLGWVVGAYLLGAIPFGLLIGFARGVDVRKHGSGNIGATNVGRVVGGKWGKLCLALDLLKGFVPAFVASFFLVQQPVNATMLLQWLAVALAAVLGHVFPVYLGFRGGKGVATTIGATLGVFPYLTWPMLATLVGYGIARALTGMVSVGSVVIAVLLPVAFFVYVQIDPALTLAVFWPIQAATIVLGVLILVRHADNIRRLLRGEERRFKSAENSAAR